VEYVGAPAIVQYRFVIERRPEQRPTTWSRTHHFNKCWSYILRRRQLIGQTGLYQVVVQLLDRLSQMTAAFDVPFDDIWQELLTTYHQSLVDASSDRFSGQKTCHKSMVIWSGISYDIC